MKPEKKAIQTLYRGYKFRSRLEARWAVFFDALGVKWEYEPEGFVLYDGTCYLPDFLLSDYGVYVEVKPTTLSFKEQDKCEKLMSTICKPVVALIGPPGSYHIDENDSDGVVFCWDMSDSSAGSSDFKFSFVFSDNNGLMFLVHTASPSKTFNESHMYEKSNRFISCMKEFREYQCFESKIIDAATYARSARFEHGETPFIR